jgi:hypothetical protein
METCLHGQGTSSIGDIAVFQKDPKIVWVGTGEGCVRNSASWGDGIYKSTDVAKTFDSMGLTDSQHIARVVTHPTESQHRVRGGAGTLLGLQPRARRLQDDRRRQDVAQAGRRIAERRSQRRRRLMIDPANPHILYANMWERIRKPYTFESGSPKWRPVQDDQRGESWTKLAAACRRVGRQDRSHALSVATADPDRDR